MTTTNTVPAGKYGVAPYKNRAPSRIENGVTSCVKSTIRTSGIIPYITPRHSATESSTTPKSVIKTIVGGYFRAASLPAPGSPFLAFCAKSKDVVAGRNERNTPIATNHRDKKLRLLAA